FFFFSSRRRHTRFSRDWSSDVCSSDLCHLSGVWPEMAATLSNGSGNSIQTQTHCDCGGDRRPQGSESVSDCLLFFLFVVITLARSEERRVGREWRSRVWSEHAKVE